ncbi:UDP-N-acetylmuramoyl-L-alanine--D-glutamate ligase [Methylacidiphilum caldifontis]|uniref:UDP-N-acetylmuramoyl-L-alanine--D-glutamate ligase n=1 Tax=Methylacidiphilum caldifontis TaxID=2795386 RepID=UPI001A8E98D7|nr:UDP-N-acetylmuramoyl-L-alanine--D-glutamate ligase [Methylacidiphilum caldifontis]QSR87889.1 UDP-N-acetylmuramoyl-L-alanine--D-glutamate ligase [Methylacidiphilum caldifontis]
MIDSIRNFFLGKKTLVWGLGMEGQATLELLLKTLPETLFYVCDRDLQALNAINNPWVKKIEENQLLKQIDQFELIVKSPGIRTAHLSFDPSLKKRIVLQTELFLRFWPGKTIGVTGSKGKSTTSSLIYHLLKQGGFKVYMGGNIGIPPFRLIPFADEKSIAVLELSSYQLEYCRHSPSIALWLNLYQEHLNYHGSFEAYAHAKSNIARFQSIGDYFIYNQDNPDLTNYLFSQEKMPGIPVQLDGKEDNLIDLSRLKIPGKHNKKNALFAATAALLLGMPANAIAEALDSFQGLPHRLEYVATVKGVAYYNDSISTVPEATLAGIEAIPSVRSLIIGGQDRGISLESFSSRLCELTMIENLILLPETGWRIGYLLKDKCTKKNIFFAKDLEEAVLLASRYTPKGYSCLFSPAAPSYHLYLNFEKRGEHFKNLVLQL